MCFSLTFFHPFLCSLCNIPLVNLYSFLSVYGYFMVYPPDSGAQDTDLVYQSTKWLAIVIGVRLRYRYKSIAKENSDYYLKYLKSLIFCTEVAKCEDVILLMPINNKTIKNLSGNHAKGQISRVIKLRKNDSSSNYFLSLDPPWLWSQNNPLTFWLYKKIFISKGRLIWVFFFFFFNNDNLCSKNNFVFRSILPEIYRKIKRWVQSIHDDSVKDINVGSMTTEAIAFSSWNTEYSRL